MSDRIQITFFLDGYIIEGWLDEENMISVAVMAECTDHDGQCSSMNCLTCDNHSKSMQENILTDYEDKMVRAIRAVVKELGVM